MKADWPVVLHLLPCSENLLTLLSVVVALWESTSGTPHRGRFIIFIVAVSISPATNDYHTLAIDIEVFWTNISSRFLHSVCISICSTSMFLSKNSFYFFRWGINELGAGWLADLFSTFSRSWPKTDQRFPFFVKVYGSSLGHALSDPMRWKWENIFLVLKCGEAEILWNTAPFAGIKLVEISGFTFGSISGNWFVAKAKRKFRI